jgi:RNA polymerase sigma-32 factor
MKNTTETNYTPSTSNGFTEPYKAYIDTIKHYPVLTVEQEQQLARKAANGHKPSFDKLVNSNLRLVVKIAREYKVRAANFLDLIQEGNLGLIYGVKKFDPDKKIRLSTYAQFWIRAYILKFLMDNHKLVKVGTTQVQRKLFYNLRKVQAKMAANGEKPTPENLAEKLGVKVSDVEEMQERLYAGELSIYAPRQNDSEYTLIDSLRADMIPTDKYIDRRNSAEHLKKRISEFRSRLKGRDTEIWDLRMCAEDPMTLQQLGDHFSISRERARQLESRIIGNLEKYIRSDREYIDAYELGTPCVLN